jgi:formate hydrogenlyase transcriptional activator
MVREECSLRGKCTAARHMSPVYPPASDLERMVVETAKGVWSDTGANFFRSLVRQLCKALQADFVHVGALLPGGERVGILAARTPVSDVTPFEYALAGAPCAEVIVNRACSYAEGVHRLFPQDRGLVEMRAEGYVGAPLMDSNGRCLGLICAITRRPLENAKLAEALLQIFAGRAAAELERKNSEDALARSEERLRSFVTHGNEAMIRIELEVPVSPSVSEEQQIDHLYRYGFVADCNQQAAALFGLTSPDALVGARIETIAPRDDPQQMERNRAGVRAGWRHSQVERKFGERTLLMTREASFEDGHLTGGWVTGRDITALKEAEAQVHRLNSELEGRVEELTQLKARLEQDNAYLQEEIRAEHHLHEMVGSSPPFRELVSRIQMVARTNATVLISGETGTGKELVARAIHDLSPRRDRPLVKVNCAAISAGLVESELFGHVKGAFTGAATSHVGRFEFASGGTLFLDEITELPLESQAKLLRVLQEQEFEPVGSNRTVKVDVRLLAATNRSLPEAVRDGRLRMDLYYRLLVVPVEVPSLRERREDIPALVDHFIARLARQFGRRVRGVSKSMMQQLLAYDWPGNIRELENLLARAIVLCPGDIDGHILDAPVFGGDLAPQPEPQVQTASMEDAERSHIQSVLVATRWVVEGPKGAAALLSMNPSTLRSRMKRLGISRPV